MQETDQPEVAVVARYLPDSDRHKYKTINVYVQTLAGENTLDDFYSTLIKDMYVERDNFEQGSDLLNGIKARWCCFSVTIEAGVVWNKVFFLVHSGRGYAITCIGMSSAEGEPVEYFNKMMQSFRFTD